MAESHDKPADGAAEQKHGGGGHGHGGGGHGGGGGHEEAHEGAPEWLISFADNVALMMGFFVVLLCMNMAKTSVGGGGSKGDTGITSNQDETMLDFALAVREAFNNPVDINSGNPADQPLVEHLRKRKGQSDSRVKGVQGHEQDVQSIRPSEYYAVSGSVPFGEGASELTPTGLTTIRDIAGRVRGMSLIVEVRGNVSSVESQRGPESCMKLSYDRALAVAHALAANGVDWWQMHISLYADNDRVDSFPASREADKANARVEIILTDKVVPNKVATKNGDAPEAPANTAVSAANP